MQTINPPKSQQIEWCRTQQREALCHMAEGHTCDHPQCHPINNERFLLDMFAEEIEILYPSDASRDVE